MPSPLLVGIDKEMKRCSFSQQEPLNLIGQMAMHAANCNITLSVSFSSLPTLSPAVCAYRTLPTGPLHSTPAAYTWMHLFLFLFSSRDSFSFWQPEGSSKECKSHHVTLLLKTFQSLPWIENKSHISYMTYKLSTGLSLSHLIRYLSP